MFLLLSQQISLLTPTNVVDMEQEKSLRNGMELRKSKC
jgi:hypothetical protein